MGQLRIKSLYDATWTVFGFQYDQAVADRNHCRAEAERHLGQEAALAVQHHVDAALGRIQIEAVDPATMKMREFYELLALELAVQEIQHRIEADAVFDDPDEIVAIFGLSWQRDALSLLDGDGQMPPENIEKFLTMVKMADQRMSFGMESSARFREWRQGLIEFLETAIKMGEAVSCEM